MLEAGFTVSVSCLRGRAGAVTCGTSHNVVVVVVVWAMHSGRSNSQVRRGGRAQAEDAAPSNKLWRGTADVRAAAAGGGGRRESDIARGVTPGWWSRR